MLHKCFEVEGLLYAGYFLKEKFIILDVPRLMELTMFQIGPTYINHPRLKVYRDDSKSIKLYKNTKIYQDDLKLALLRFPK